jgi:hypothetical protein
MQLATSSPNISLMERMLIWLPWHKGSPPFSAEARVQLGCLLRQAQRGGRLTKLPYSKPRPDLGPEVFESRVRDRPTDRTVTYRMYPDAIVIVEVLPDAPEYRVHTWAILTRLRDYEEQRTQLEGTWWQVGDVAEFLQLTPEQAALVGIRAALAAQLVQVRRDRRWGQADLARELGSSRSRIAKMELPDSSVSIDLFVKSLLALGLSRGELGSVIAGRLAGDRCGR